VKVHCFHLLDSIDSKLRCWAHPWHSARMLPEAYEQESSIPTLTQISIDDTSDLDVLVSAQNSTLQYTSVRIA
jgi:hypothetical protein